MKRIQSSLFYRLGITLLLLSGVLFTHFEKAVATPIHFQQTSDQITVTPVIGLSTSEAAGTDVYTIVLNVLPTAEVTIGLTSSDSSEGTVSPASLTFTDLNWSTPQTVTVTGVDDQIDDGDIPYQIVSAPAVSLDPTYTGQDASDVSVTNIDNDTAGITLSRTSGLATTEAGVQIPSPLC